MLTFPLRTIDWSNIILFGCNQVWPNNLDPTFLKITMWFLDVVNPGCIDSLQIELINLWIVIVFKRPDELSRDHNVFELFKYTELILLSIKHTIIILVLYFRIVMTIYVKTNDLDSNSMLLACILPSPRSSKTKKYVNGTFVVFPKDL